MDITKSVLIKIIIMVVVCWYVVSCTVGSSRSNKIYSDKLFGIQSNVYHQFPVDEDGNLISLNSLTEDEQKALLKKIKAKNPYIELKRMLNSKEGIHKRIISQIQYGEFRYIGLNCRSNQESFSHLTLNMDGAGNGRYATEIIEAWQRWGDVFNNELLDSSRQGGLYGCLKDFEYIDGKSVRRER